MGMKDLILSTILVVLIIAHVASSIQDHNVSPTGSPAVGIDKGKDNNNQTNTPSTLGNSPNDDQLKNTAPPPKSQGDAKQHDDSPKEKVEEDKKIPKEEVKSESCDGMERRCTDDKGMIACIKSIDEVSNVVALLLQNTGENSLKVDLSFSSSAYKQKLAEIPKMQTKQVNISLANVVGNEIKLRAGNGDCVLHTNLGAPVLKGNYFQWDPSYSKFVKPVYGAYLVLLVTLLSGGVCAICWFTKRKRTDEVPYQELEMSMPESAAGVDAVEGWDEVWDDDWDEEKAVKSPGPSISANGLTSRTKKGDSDNWDD
ncbi:hypothetical protein vseg_013368 [Gypsophila vaccaria]